MNNIYSFVSRVKKDIHDHVRKEIIKAGIKDLPAEHADVLLVIMKNDYTLAMNTIASETNRDKSTVTVLVNRLIKNGYVTKEQSRLDKRKQYVTITKKSLGIEEFLKSTYMVAEIQALKHLNTKDSMDLLAIARQERI